MIPRSLDEGPSGAVTGKVKAYVRRNDDPQKRGRIKCFCPQLMGPIDDEKHWTAWAEPCFPWVGGMNTMNGGPPLTKAQNGGTETGVWLEFENGKADFPIWVGTWIPAPTPTDANAQMDLSATQADVGGSIIHNPPTGSSTTDIDPPKPIADAKEIRINVRKGQELIIICDQGGCISVGPYGVNIQGANVTINGVAVVGSSANGVMR